jgi:hypothetical protein
METFSLLLSISVNISRLKYKLDFRKKRDEGWKRIRTHEGPYVHKFVWCESRRLRLQAQLWSSWSDFIGIRLTQLTHHNWLYCNNYITKHSLSNSMEYSPSWKAKLRNAPVLWNQNAHYRVHTSQSLDSVLIQMNLVPGLPLSFSRCIWILFPSTSGSSK